MATKFKWIPLAKIADEPSKGGMYRLVCNVYWVVNDQDEIPLYGGSSLQCNASEEIVKSIIDSRLYNGFNVRAVFLAKAWLPIRVQEWDYEL